MSRHSAGSKDSDGKRTIVIGDVHGCIDELEDLLSTVGVTQKDSIISVGDLVRKGPDSAAVIRWAMETPNLRCVLGNHELRLLTSWLEGEVPSRGSHDWEMYRQLGSSSYNAAMEFIRSWPLWIDEDDFLVVHAGLDPRVPVMKDQSPHDLMTIRIPSESKNPWYEDYHQEKLVVFGHWSQPEPVVRPNAIGLDTGCVYGGKLTALVLPERRLVSVAAECAYSKGSSSK
jgi:serine/threonine protein phosphatase 1